MKIAPISGDLLVRLSVVTGVGLLAWLAVQRAAAALPSLPQYPDALNPLSDQNWAYAATSGLVSAWTGRDETGGGLLAEFFNPGTREVNRLYGPDQGWRALGDEPAQYTPDATSAAPYFGA